MPVATILGPITSCDSRNRFTKVRNWLLSSILKSIDVSVAPLVDLAERRCQYSLISISSPDWCQQRDSLKPMRVESETQTRKTRPSSAQNHACIFAFNNSLTLIVSSSTRLLILFFLIDYIPIIPVYGYTLKDISGGF